MQRLIGFDPTSEPVGERLSNLRITSIALVDKLDGWDGIDSWLETERTLGTTICRQVMEAAKLGDTVERRLENLDPLMSRAHALSNNLRHARPLAQRVSPPTGILRSSLGLPSYLETTWSSVSPVRLIRSERSSSSSGTASMRTPTKYQSHSTAMSRTALYASPSAMTASA